MKKKCVYIVIAILIMILVIGYLIFFNKSKDNNDAQKFALEYGITTNNVFVYRGQQEIINILKNGTGIVYLGFPECPWCKEYVKYLNEVAKESNFNKIYYLNILNDRKNNTEEYQEIVSLLDEYLHYSDEGTKRIYVPAVIVVQNGKILGFDDETSYDTKGYETPSEYWANEDLKGFKERLKKMIKEININYCTDCN